MSEPIDPKIQLVEAGYRIDLDPSAWLREMGTTLRSAIPGMLSCFAYEIARVDGRMTPGKLWTDDPRVETQMHRLFREAPTELLDLYSSPPLLTAMACEVLTKAGVPFESTVLPDVFESMGVVDLFAVAATSPTSRGVILGICLDNHQGPGANERRMLSQVGAHVAAAARLRERPSSRLAPEQAAAILRPDGKLEHATNPDPAITQILPEAVRRVDQARRRGTDAQEALALWKGLVAGQWTLIDHFEGSGRRYYVAHENSVDGAKVKALSVRENEVVSYLASGTDTKSTAYAMGLDVVTVRGHLGTALDKLGVRTRAELIGLRAALGVPPITRADEPAGQPKDG